MTPCRGVRRCDQRVAQGRLVRDTRQLFRLSPGLRALNRACTGRQWAGRYANSWLAASESRSSVQVFTAWPRQGMDGDEVEAETSLIGQHACSSEPLDTRVWRPGASCSRAWPTRLFSSQPTHTMKMVVAELKPEETQGSQWGRRQWR